MNQRKRLLVCASSVWTTVCLVRFRSGRFVTGGMFLDSVISSALVWWSSPVLLVFTTQPKFPLFLSNITKGHGDVTLATEALIPDA